MTVVSTNVIMVPCTCRPTTRLGRTLEEEEYLDAVLKKRASRAAADEEAGAGWLERRDEASMSVSAEEAARIYAAFRAYERLRAKVRWKQLPVTSSLQGQSRGLRSPWPRATR